MGRDEGRRPSVGGRAKLAGLEARELFGEGWVAKMKAFELDRFCSFSKLLGN